MSARVMRLTIEMSLCWGLICPSIMPSQSPGLGRLVITSKPTGAKIFINDKPMQQLTDFTYVISPGDYKVKVTDGTGNLNCLDKPVSVSPGQEVTVLCTEKGWE